VRAISEPSPTDVGAERALLDQARDAEDAHDPEGALKLLDTHAARYPHGQMWEEREALAIDGLVEAQKYTEARARAAKLRSRSPNSLVLPAVDETLRSIP
jgi:predicted Zn-dependent protease